MTRPDYRDAIGALNIIKHLADFGPHVAGTLPLGLETEKSDIDVLCETVDIDRFAQKVWALYSDRTGFRMRQWLSNGQPVIASFTAYGWEFEIYGSTEPVERQPGWLHFTVERRLLSLGGASFREKIMELRHSGSKTEPAFWAALRQSGNAYSGMLSLLDRSDDALAKLLTDAGFNVQSEL